MRTCCGPAQPGSDSRLGLELIRAHNLNSRYGHQKSFEKLVFIMRTLTILIFLFQRTFDGHIYYLGCEPEFDLRDR
jgi:hypothetical protein